MQPEYIQPQNRGNIIYISGVSSAGKTSTARELERILDGTHKYISRDDFMGRYEREHTKELSQMPRSAVSSCLDTNFYRSIAQLASTGMNVIVDGIAGKEHSSKRAAKILADYNVTLVLLKASRESLEAREKQRGNRRIGLSHSQLGRVYNAKRYDLEVDTSTNDPTSCAFKIVSYLSSSKNTWVPTSSKFWDDSYRPRCGKEIKRDDYLSELERRDPRIRNGLEYLSGLLQERGLGAIVTGSSVLGEPDSDIDIAVFGDRTKFTELLNTLQNALRVLKADDTPTIQGLDIKVAENVEYCETEGLLTEFGNFDIVYSTEFKPGQIESYIRRLVERGKSYVVLTEFPEPAPK